MFNIVKETAKNAKELTTISGSKGGVWGIVRRSGSLK